MTDLSALADENDRLRQDLADAETEDADARECACDGPCCMECRENGYPDAMSYRDQAVKHARAARVAAEKENPDG